MKSVVYKAFNTIDGRYVIEHVTSKAKAKLSNPKYRLAPILFSLI